VRLALVALAACGGGGAPRDVIAPSASSALPAHREILLDDSPKERKRMVPPEAFLRAYLVWFGDVSPDEAFLRARGFGLFDAWTDYLAALGLPDYRIDIPRTDQTNTMMLATIGRLGEALCVRSAEHDLRRTDEPQRIFAFVPKDAPTLEEFTERFDVLHRTFLGYPVELAPAQRAARFYDLYRQVRDRHPTGRLKPDELAWTAMCTALIQHPEALLY